MSNLLGELIFSITQAIQEVFNKPELKVNPPNCLEDDLAELEPIEPDEMN